MVRVTSTERTYDRARYRAAEMTRRIGAELRAARLSAGRSQRDVARAARISQSQLGRIELGRLLNVSVTTLTTIAAVVGLDMVVNLYPGPRIVRDTPQIRLLLRLRERLGDDWTWRYEVPVRHGDQRAWDARARHRRTGVEFVVEAETRLHDIQASLRRVALKREASGTARVVLLVASTHRNRDAIRVARPMLDAEFPTSTRTTLVRLTRGLDPGTDALIVLGPGGVAPGES